MDQIILSAHFVTDGLQTEHFLDCLKISLKHEKAVERLTLGQRDDPVWQNLRKGRPLWGYFEGQTSNFIPDGARNGGV